jgi:hypothetical protein
MNCHDFEQLLLHADDPKVAIAQNDAAAHLAQCAACAQLVARLSRLGDAAGHVPPPPSSADAKAAFLRTLEPRRFYIGRRTLAVAASIVIVAGLATWAALHYLNPQPTVEQVVTQLVDYNIELAKAETPARRQQIFNASHKQLQRMLDRGRFTGDDAELAKKLIDDGRNLANAADPYEEAERIGDLADDLLKRTHAAARLNDVKRAAQLGSAYSYVSNMGLEPKLNRMPPNEARKAQMEKLQARRAEMERRMDRLIDNTPGPAKQALMNARENARKNKPRPRGTF